MRTAAALLVALAAGCTPARDHRDPAPGFRVIAVLPCAGPVDGDEFADLLASELVKAGGVRVLRPAQIRAAAEGAILTADDALRVARRLRADAILACAVTDYDPYDPPRVAVSAQLLSVEAGDLSGRDLDRMLQSGSWRRGPLTMSRDRAGHAVAAFEEVYDAREKTTRRALQAYVEGRVEDERETLAVQSRYLQFVSNRLITRVLAHGT